MTNEEANIIINKFMEDKKMERGRVNWFNDGKGFGFIERPNNQGDLFVHFQNIIMKGHKTLYPGNIVEYEIEENEKGEHAINVRRIDNE